jgi:hypothetical protein
MILTWSKWREDYTLVITGRLSLCSRVYDYWVLWRRRRLSRSLRKFLKLLCSKYKV